MIEESGHQVWVMLNPSAAGKSLNARQWGMFDRDKSTEIRVWVKAQGKKANERGRILQALVDEYQAAQC